MCLDDFSSATHGSDVRVFNKKCCKEWVSFGSGDVAKCQMCRMDVNAGADAPPAGSLMDGPTSVCAFAANSQLEGHDILIDDNIVNGDAQDTCTLSDCVGTTIRSENSCVINSASERIFRNNAQMKIVFPTNQNHRIQRSSELHPRHATAEGVTRWSSATFNGSIVCDLPFRDRNPMTIENSHRHCSSEGDFEHKFLSVNDGQGGCTFGGGTSAGGKGGRFWECFLGGFHPLQQMLSIGNP